jgi:hypothetical protein
MSFTITFNSIAAKSNAPLFSAILRAHITFQLMCVGCEFSWESMHYVAAEPTKLSTTYHYLFVHSS